MGGDTSDVRRASTILLVDDQYAALLNLRFILEPEGYRTIAVTSGQAALDACRTVRVDLVVLDVVMPEMDGIEVARRLYLQPETAAVPIVFCTAAPAQIRSRSTRLADEVSILSKPVHPEALRLTVHRLLARSFHHAAASRVCGSRG